MVPSVCETQRQARHMKEMRWFEFSPLHLSLARATISEYHLESILQVRLFIAQFDAKFIALIITDLIPVLLVRHVCPPQPLAVLAGANVLPTRVAIVEWQAGIVDPLPGCEVALLLG